MAGRSCGDGPAAPSKFAMLDAWTYLTFGYCSSGVSKRLISTFAIVKTNDNSTLLLKHGLFCFSLFVEKRIRLCVLFELRWGSAGALYIS